MKINIDEATATQLAEFAQTSFGIECHYKQGPDAIRSKLAQVGFSGSQIEVADPAPERTQAAAPEGPRETIRIVISKQDIPGGKEAVAVRVNGKVARIMRGEPVDVPVEYVHALTNAQSIQYETGPNGEPINPTRVPKVPFTIMRQA